MAAWTDHEDRMRIEGIREQLELEERERLLEGREEEGEQDLWREEYKSREDDREYILDGGDLYTNVRGVEGYRIACNSDMGNLGYMERFGKDMLENYRKKDKPVLNYDD